MSINESSKKLLRTIEEGLQNGEFKMYLQFIVDNKTKGIVSAEALSRWETEEGVVSPGKYIRAMEDSGLITVLDYQMFENACRKLSEWARTERDAISISCNFTRITISDADFADKIREIADKYSFERHKLIVEITEDSIESNFEVAKENIVATKTLGFTVALDDVGNGYTPPSAIFAIIPSTL